MADWQVGDLAVCVNLVPRNHDTYPGLERLKVRAIYRVTFVTVCPGSGEAALGFAEVKSISPSGAFWAGRFRKIQPAEPCFTEAMRNLKPRVEA